MKIMLICLLGFLLPIALNAKDCLVDFNTAIRDAEIAATEGFQDCESHWDTNGHCNLEVYHAYSHAVGTAAIEFDECAEEEGLYP